MKIGQIWESLDKREGPLQKQVIAITAGRAELRAVGGTRRSFVDCVKFLKRSGTKSGYKLVRDA